MVIIYLLTECQLQCSNGGTPNIDTCIECICPNGYASATCDDDINECQINNTCGNNGHCINTYGGYSCKCESGYTGNNCEVDVNECETGVCKHDAICQNTDGSYECICTTHFTGKNCDEYKCSCFNGGDCSIKNGSIICDCTGTGYTGNLCTNDIDECKDAPCPYGRCINTDGSYSCTEGEYCKINICLHGGICYNISDNHICNCTKGWSGERCDICNFEIIEGECVEIHSSQLNQHRNSLFVFEIGRLMIIIQFC